MIRPSDVTPGERSKDGGGGWLAGCVTRVEGWGVGAVCALQQRCPERRLKRCTNCFRELLGVDVAPGLE